MIMKCQKSTYFYAYFSVFGTYFSQPYIYTRALVNCDHVYNLPTGSSCARFLSLMKPRRCAVIITAVLYYSEFVIAHRHVPPIFASCVNKTCVMCTPSSLRVSIRSMPCAPHPFFWLQVTIRLGHVQPLPIFASCVDGSAMCTPLSLLYVSIKSLSCAPLNFCFFLQ